MNEVSRLIDEAALCLITSDDPTSCDLKRVEEVFLELSKLLHEGELFERANQVSDLATHVSNLRNGNRPDSDQVLRVVTDAIVNLQQEMPENFVVLPEETTPSNRGLAANAVTPVGGSLPAGQDPELVAGFAAEAIEHLETADVQLLRLENQPKDQESLSAVFRVFHTIKGIAGFLEFTAIASVAHEAENLLDMAREGKLILEGVVIDAIFTAVDTLKKLASSPESPPDDSIKNLIETLRRIAEAAEAVPGQTFEQDSLATLETKIDSLSVATKSSSSTLRVDSGRLDSLVDTIGELVIAEAMLQQDFRSGSRAAENGSRNLAQLNKITRNLQELSLSLRMVPIRATFQKMARMVRDLSKKLGKPIDFSMTGEDTDLDKTVVDQIGDPLMHMVRNASTMGLNLIHNAELMQASRSVVM